MFYTQDFFGLKITGIQWIKIGAGCCEQCYCEFLWALPKMPKALAGQVIVILAT